MILLIVAAAHNEFLGTDKLMPLVASKDASYNIIGCAMAVHNELGPGLREGIYQRALAVKMDAAGFVHEEERRVQVFIDGCDVGLLYLDHLVDESVIVEVKALKHKLTDDEIGQVITYLAATGLKVGLLLNFAGKSLEYKRIFPPRKVDVWQHRIRRYTWQPHEQRPH
jgi:GxxExxY protein